VASLPMTLGHIHAGTDAADGKIVVVGGVTNGFVNTSKIHVFDPTQNRWSVGGSLPAPRKSVNLMIDNGTLFIAGGGNNVATTSGYKMPWGDAARTTPGSYEPTDDRQLFSSRAIELVQI
jgi:N-acetylneuraminic acid mutarotase